jgi:hypothetical protein
MHVGATTVIYSRTMEWLRASLVIQFLLAVYFQAILWFRLGAWNDQPGKRLLETAEDGHAGIAIAFALLFFLPFLLFAVAFWKHLLWLMWVGVVGYSIWAIMQIQSWWIPWIVGPNSRAQANQEALRRTYKFFPESLQHPAPDAMHFTLDMLLFAALITLFVGLLRTLLKPEND